MIVLVYVLIWHASIKLYLKFHRILRSKASVADLEENRGDFEKNPCEASPQDQTDSLHALWNLLISNGRGLICVLIYALILDLILNMLTCIDVCLWGLIGQSILELNAKDAYMYECHVI